MSSCASAVVAEVQPSLADERDEARWVARQLWEFIEEGGFLDDLPMGEHGSPERRLWTLGFVSRDIERNVMRAWPPEDE